jgi:hypothetical protein
VEDLFKIRLFETLPNYRTHIHLERGSRDVYRRAGGSIPDSGRMTGYSETVPGGLGARGFSRAADYAPSMAHCLRMSATPLPASMKSQPNGAQRVINVGTRAMPAGKVLFRPGEAVRVMPQIDQKSLVSSTGRVWMTTCATMARLSGLHLSTVSKRVCP